MQWSASFIIFIHYKIFNMFHLLPPQKKTPKAQNYIYITNAPQLLIACNNSINTLKQI